MIRYYGVYIYIVMEPSYNAVVNDSKDGQIGAWKLQWNDVTYILSNTRPLLWIYSIYYKLTYARNLYFWLQVNYMDGNANATPTPIQIHEREKLDGVLAFIV